MMNVNELIEKIKSCDYENSYVEIVVDGYGISDEYLIGKYNDMFGIIDVNMEVFFEYENVDDVIYELFEDEDIKIDIEDLNGYEIVNGSLNDSFEELEIEKLK